MEIAVYYLILIVVILGVLGNVVAFAVCSRKKLQNTVFSIYFRFILLIDTCVLVFNGLRTFIEYETNFQVINVSNDFCRLINIAQYMSATSGWITSVISVDRLLSLRFPARFSLRKKSWFQVGVCFGLLVKDFVVYSQNYLSYLQKTFLNGSNGTVSESVTCQLDSIQALEWIDLFNAVLVNKKVLSKKSFIWDFI
jgi:hypothetical protein